MRMLGTSSLSSCRVDVQEARVTIEDREDALRSEERATKNAKDEAEAEAKRVVRACS